MIKHIRGEVEVNDYVAPASTAFTFNDVVTRNSAGKLALATQSTPRSELLGLIQQEIASTDADYASDKVVAVLEFNEEAEFEATVEAGTPASTMVGKRFDLNSEDGITVNAEMQKCFQIKSVQSSTLVRGKFITTGDKMRIVSYQQTVDIADFTDGGGATGTLALDVTIPAGAVFLQSLLTNLTGAVGDSTATIQVGDGTDADRYSTGTPSVSADADAGADLGVPSGTKFHSASKVPVITITEDDDFTDITALAFTITLFWFEAN